MAEQEPGYIEIDCNSALGLIYSEPPDRIGALLHFAALREVAPGIPWGACLDMAARGDEVLRAWLESYLQDQIAKERGL